MDPFLVDGIYIDLGTIDRLQPVLFDCILISSGKKRIDHFVGEHIFSVHFLNNASGRFAATEAGNVQSGRIFAKCSVGFFVIGFSVDKERKLVGVDVSFFCGACRHKTLLNLGIIFLFIIL